MTPHAANLRLGELGDADRAGWEPLAPGDKLFYKTTLPDAGYDQAWRRLRQGGKRPGGTPPGPHPLRPPDDAAALTQP